MLKKLIKNKKAQNTAEYAILISLVIAGIIAMQTYAQRALQARIKDASSFMTSVNVDGMGNTAQYEPYYLSSSYNSTRDGIETKGLANKKVTRGSQSNATRIGGGHQTSSYTQYGLVNGI